MKTVKILVACMMVAVGAVSAAALAAGTAKKPAKAAKTAPAGGRVVVVYYFHTTWRCMKCTAMEGYADEALKGAFAKELKSGKLAWKPVNTDEPLNAHFVEDYKLTTKALIVSDTRDGREKSWKNLDQVWALVGNKEAYIKYVQDNVREALKAK
jgi:hypothetical protein